MLRDGGVYLEELLGVSLGVIMETAFIQDNAILMRVMDMRSEHFAGAMSNMLRNVEEAYQGLNDQDQGSTQRAGRHKGITQGALIKRMRGLLCPSPRKSQQVQAVAEAVPGSSDASGEEGVPKSPELEDGDPEQVGLDGPQEGQSSETQLLITGAEMRFQQASRQVKQKKALNQKDSPPSSGNEASYTHWVHDMTWLRPADRMPRNGAAVKAGLLPRSTFAGALEALEVDVTKKHLATKTLARKDLGGYLSHLTADEKNAALSELKMTDEEVRTAASKEPDAVRRISQVRPAFGSDWQQLPLEKVVAQLDPRRLLAPAIPQHRLISKVSSATDLRHLRQGRIYDVSDATKREARQEEEEKEEEKLTRDRSSNDVMDDAVVNASLKLEVPPLMPRTQSDKIQRTWFDTARRVPLPPRGERGKLVEAAKGQNEVESFLQHFVTWQRFRAQGTLARPSDSASLRAELINNDNSSNNNNNSDNNNSNNNSNINNFLSFSMSLAVPPRVHHPVSEAENLSMAKSRDSNHRSQQTATKQPQNNNRTTSKLQETSQQTATKQQ
ncbi:unnamed protein product [Polarella glacialis]|uniref:Uncharacterized protein n=1 Tax=Polarella glacialis TaxID=89957 RepID=A0A813E691_POLGL|nr:unnamed protein product [Polarella glacialis]